MPTLSRIVFRAARRRAVETLLAFAVSGATASARADEEAEKQTCVAAYGATQELRLAGALRAASERAKLCSQASCPTVVRDGCTKWLTAIRDSMPSIVVVAQGIDGKDVSDVKAYVDGELAADGLTGRAIDVDPGEHRLRVEYHQEPPVEQTIVVAEGTKSRQVRVSFAKAIEPASAPEGPRAPRGETSVPAGAVALTTIGVAGLAGFGILAGLGTKEVAELRDSCGRNASCSAEDIAPARTKLIAGDVLLGVGGLSAAFGLGWLAYYYATKPVAADTEGAALELEFAPSAQGLAALMRGRF